MRGSRRHRTHASTPAPEILVEARAMYHIDLPSTKPPSGSPVAATAPKPRHLANGRAVLLIDDELTIVQALQLWLTAAGYEVLTAHDGSRAWPR